MPKKNENMAETWHNALIDRRGGKVHVSAIKTFCNPDVKEDPPIYPRGAELWLDAQKGYEWYLMGLVSVTLLKDPLDGKRKPSEVTEKEKRRKMYRENPYVYGRAQIEDNFRTREVPLDHIKKPWVKVSVNGKDTYVPEEFASEYQSVKGAEHE